MHFTSSLATLAGALTLLQGVSARCYNTGEDWPNTEEARKWVEDACFSKGGMFTGYYAPSQSKQMCPKSKFNNMGVYFEVRNDNRRDGFDLNDQDCYNRLTDEIFGCKKGGARGNDEGTSGWYFRADPGAC